MSLIKDFRDFAFKGNMIDMAVGIVIGGAFGAYGHLAGQRHCHAVYRDV